MICAKLVTYCNGSGWNIPFGNMFKNIYLCRQNVMQKFCLTELNAYLCVIMLDLKTA